MADLAPVGRFAPSPTGLLHLGSLLAAVSSYLHARQAGGRWLVRIEDIDPPREQAGASAAILQCLEQHGLTWDGDVLFQSRRQSRYQEVLAALRSRGLLYRCSCSRRAMAAAQRPDCVSDCHLHSAPSGAWRLRARDHVIHYQDQRRGLLQEALAETCGDFILQRRDGLFAYQLAVVVDDIDSGITQVVRGADLLDNTARQCALIDVLGSQRPVYLHLPLVIGHDGQKLSKQNWAPALDLKRPSHNLWQVLTLLGQDPPAGLAQEHPEVLLAWGVQHWQPERIPVTPQSCYFP